MDTITPSERILARLIANRNEYDRIIEDLKASIPNQSRQEKSAPETVSMTLDSGATLEVTY